MIVFISHVSNVMIKLFQTRLQEYMNQDLPDAQAGIRKGRGTRDPTANIHWIVEKVREFQKNIYFCFIDYTKAFGWITTNCGKFLEMGVPNHVTCLLRNLCAGKKATVKTRHGTMYWFKTGKGVQRLYGECHYGYLTLMCYVLSCPVMSHSLQPLGLYSLPGSPVHQDSPGKYTGVGCHVLLQGIFPTQGWNPGFLHCRRILYHLSHQESQAEWITSWY